MDKPQGVMLSQINNMEKTNTGLPHLHMILRQLNSQLQWWLLRVLGVEEMGRQLTKEYQLPVTR